MRKGTIIRNHWASDKNPTRYFIYMGIKGRFAEGIELVDGKLNTVRYHKEDFLNSEAFEKVGYCIAFDILKSDLKKFIEGELR